MPLRMAISEQNDKVVELEFKVSKEKVYLRIKDEGAGFSPQQVTRSDVAKNG